MRRSLTEVSTINIDTVFARFPAYLAFVKMADTTAARAAFEELTTALNHLQIARVSSLK